MSTKELTHEASSEALSSGAALTPGQRAALLGLVADDKRKQTAYDASIEQASWYRFLKARCSRVDGESGAASWHIEFVSPYGMDNDGQDDVDEAVKAAITQQAPSSSSGAPATAQLRDQPSSTRG